MIPFNKPALLGAEREYVRAALDGGRTSANGAFTQKCHDRLRAQVGCKRALLTQSGTAALELAALLLNLDPGDEIVMPSFAFVSTANAFVLRRAVPVFVDIRPDTLNIDEHLIEEAITPRTRAIVALHYAGIACEMDAILSLAERHGLHVIEDAAHALGATFRGRPLGSLGRLGVVSFHETKNITAGECGALLLNDDIDNVRAERLWEKGTNRGEFSRGHANEYTWVDIGSSFAPSELTAAFLYAQLEHIDRVLSDRVRVWNAYHAALEPLEQSGALRRPVVPAHCTHNAHIYYVLLSTTSRRSAVINTLRSLGVEAAFHFVPLHTSPAGRRFGRFDNDLPMTVDASARLVRLPLWFGMSDDEIRTVTAAVQSALGHQSR